MKRRIERKQNKKRIKSLLIQLKPLRVHNVRFLNGYFIIYKGSAAVCHFYLKELPHWKLAIWLGKEGGYTMFGQITNLIDKFKPSYSELESNNVVDFKEKLIALIANGGFLDDEEKECYLEDLKIREEAKVWNLNAYRKVSSFIETYNQQNPDRFLELRDLGSGAMPRYWVDLFHAIGKDVVDDELTKLQEDVDSVCNIDKGRLPCYYTEEFERGRW